MTKGTRTERGANISGNRQTAPRAAGPRTAPDTAALDLLAGALPDGAAIGPDRIVAAVTRGLHDGAFTPGDRLSERELAERFALPRAAVRDALRRLQDGGLVEFVPYRGAQIRNPTLRELRDGLMVLERLFGLAARLAAERVGEGDVRERVASAWAELQRSPQPLSGYEGAKAREKFHAAIAQACGARDVLRLTPDAQMHLLQAEWPADPEDPLASCRAVVRAVLSGAPHEAETAARAHVAAMLTALEA